MDLTQITEVAKTDRTEEANALLEKGWVLLSTAGGTDDEGSPTFWHCLGFPGRSGIE